MHKSVGAVIYTIKDNLPMVLLMYRKNTNTYHLPKGTQEPGEKMETTLFREIKEETNCQIILRQKLCSARSKYKRAGKTIQKKTYYFVAQYANGELKSTDGEHDEVMFVPLSKAKELLRDLGANKLGWEDEYKVLKCFSG